MNTDSPFSDPRGTPKSAEDYFQSEDYQRFVEELAKSCRCAKDRPCDGLLAGGLCDDIQDDERDSNDSPLDEEDRNDC